MNKMAEVEATKMMIDRVEESSPSNRGDWWAIRTTVSPQCWGSWLMKKGSYRTFQSGINQSITTALLAVPISSSTLETTNMFALPASISGRPGAARRKHRFAIGPVSTTARFAS